MMTLSYSLRKIKPLETAVMSNFFINFAIYYAK